MSQGNATPRVTPALCTDVWPFILSVARVPQTATIRYFKSVFRVEFGSREDVLKLLTCKEWNRVIRELRWNLFRKQVLGQGKEDHWSLLKELLKEQYHKNVAAWGAVAVDVAGSRWEANAGYVSQPSERFPGSDLFLPELKQVHLDWLQERSEKTLRFAVRSLFANIARRELDFVPNPHTFGRLLRFLQSRGFRCSVAVHYRPCDSGGETGVFERKGPLLPVLLGMVGTGHKGTDDEVPISLVGDPNGEDVVNLQHLYRFTGNTDVPQEEWVASPLANDIFPGSYVLCGGDIDVTHHTERDVARVVRCVSCGESAVPEMKKRVRLRNVATIQYGELHTSTWHKPREDGWWSHDWDLLKLLLYNIVLAHLMVCPSARLSRQNVLQHYGVSGSRPFNEFLERRKLYPDNKSKLRRIAIILGEPAFERQPDGSRTATCALKELLGGYTVERAKFHHKKLNEFAVVCPRDDFPTAGEIFAFLEGIMRRPYHSGLCKALREIDVAPMSFVVCFPYDASAKQPDLRDFVPKQFDWNLTGEVTEFKLSVHEYRCDPDAELTFFTKIEVTVRRSSVFDQKERV